MITLYQFEISPFCDKIRRILQVKCVPYTVRNIRVTETATTLRKVNPIGKVPCLDDGGHLVADSTDIAHYLEERYPEPRLIPTAPRERALCHMLEDWADESLYFYEVRMRFGFPSNTKRTVDRLLKDEPALIRKVAPLVVPTMMKRVGQQQGIGRKPEAVVVRDVERHADAVQDWLEGREWLVGEALSLADISVFAQLACIRETQEGGSVVAARPALARWMERVDAATAGTPVQDAEAPGRASARAS
jgi:glutathione S-transferase